MGIAYVATGVIGWVSPDRGMKRCSQRTNDFPAGPAFCGACTEFFHFIERRTQIRDYTLLHLLYDSGARASEIAELNVDYFNPNQKALSILGKGNRFRLIKLEPKTCHLLQLYIYENEGDLMAWLDSL